MTVPVVEIDHVTKTFDDLIAVNDISLRVDRGQTLGLIGPNGAGKTTLLRLISSLAKPDSGEVRIDGDSVSSNPRLIRKKLGFMPAEFGSPRNLTIFEYLDYFGCLYGIPSGEREQRISEVCELTDLTGREDIMVKGLSTGNRQRLLLAKTLLHDPQLLVLDEPSSGLDPRARTELRVIIKELASMGKTIIISSHILPDIEDFSDSICIIEAGRLVVDGNLTTLKSAHEKTRRSIRLKVASDAHDNAISILKSDNQAVAVNSDGEFLTIETEATNGNFVLASMLSNDIRVLQFIEDEPSLEDIFLRTTAGKVT